VKPASGNTRTQPGSAEEVFASGAYWREYYESLGHENRVAGEFLSDVAKPLGAERRLRILDAGCGPTALYWAVFIPGSHEHHGFDLSEANIRSARAQIDDAGRGRIDGGLLEAARHAVAHLGIAATPPEQIAAKARQIESLQMADLGQPWPYDAASFDLVQSCFAMECLPNAATLTRALSQAQRMLRPDGWLALVNVARSTNWMCDGRSFATLTLTPGKMRDILAAAGFSAIEVREIGSGDVSNREQGYSSIMLSRAQKAARG